MNMCPLLLTGGRGTASPGQSPIFARKRGLTDPPYAAWIDRGGEKWRRSLRNGAPNVIRFSLHLLPRYRARLMARYIKCRGLRADSRTAAA